MMNQKSIHECVALSFADTPFPAVAAKLAAAGVISYRADLVLLRETLYGDESEAVSEDLPLRDAPLIAGRFDAGQVRQSVSSIQKGRIGYAEFLRRIMQAGCTSYEVYLRGRKVAYRGRDGDEYVEHMPAAKP